MKKYSAALHPRAALHVRAAAVDGAPVDTAALEPAASAVVEAAAAAVDVADVAAAVCKQKHSAVAAPYNPPFCSDVAAAVPADSPVP